MAIESAAERHNRNIKRRQRAAAKNLEARIPLRMFKTDGKNACQRDLDRNIKAANLMHLIDLRHEWNDDWPTQEQE